MARRRTQTPCLQGVAFNAPVTVPQMLPIVLTRSLHFTSQEWSSAQRFRPSVQVAHWLARAGKPLQRCALHVAGSHREGEGVKGQVGMGCDGCVVWSLTQLQEGEGEEGEVVAALGLVLGIHVLDVEGTKYCRGKL